MEDASIFQGIVEFEMAGQKIRAVKSGPQSRRRGTRGIGGTYEIYRERGGAYVRERTVQIRGNATPSAIAAAIEDAETADERED